MARGSVKCRENSLYVDTMSTAASEGYRRRKAYVCDGSEQHSQQVRQRRVAVAIVNNSLHIYLCGFNFRG